MLNKQLIYTTALLLLLTCSFLGGCANNINPLDTQSPSTNNSASNPPSTQLSPADDFKVTYNYNGTDKVQLSANNITLKVGQRLILEPAAGLTKNTRFTSSGENFFGDIMKQETDPKETGRVVFTAIKAGKGKLLIIPNTNELDRSVDLWVTVQ